MKGMTKRQRDIVDYIDEFIQKHRHSPSYREIMGHFGFSCVGTVSKHIQALKRKGILGGEKNCSRSLVLNVSPSLKSVSEQTCAVPLIGTIQAGHPIELYPKTTSISIPESFVHNKDSTYALQTKGDGLEEEMIAEGDLLIIEARQPLSSGETVIVLINGHDTMVKQYHQEDGYIKLVGRNPQHHPIIIHEEDVSVQAVVIGLLRTFKSNLP